MEEKPWSQGPKELLNHARDHLKKGDGFDIRIAMVSIDNAVELMIKTYLGLPKRVTGLSLSKKEIEESFESFPKLLQALERYVPTHRLIAEDFNEIEYFHKVRNNLYHNEVCLTIEKDKAEAYFAIAELLYNKLFCPGEITKEMLVQFKTTIGQFIFNWNRIESLILKFIDMELGIKTPDIIHINLLVEKKIFGKDFVEEFNMLRQYRNKIIHSLTEINTEELEENVGLVDSLLSKIEGYYSKKGYPGTSKSLLKSS